MEVIVLHEAGYREAMLGLSLSHNQPPSAMPKVAQKLCNKDGGHNKFLESIAVWLDITAPRFWWCQFDTYRAGVTKQSGSTMHTLMSRNLIHDDFAQPISSESLEALNRLRESGRFERLKNELPEGFMQRRIVCTNYQTLRRMIKQRRTHRLKEWHIFIDEMLRQLQRTDFLEDLCEAS